MKNFQIAKLNCWLTQKELKEGEKRFFLKMAKKVEGKELVEWTDEQRKEYFKEKMASLFGKHAAGKKK